MIPGLNPLFALNVVGPNTVSGSFVTPDQDITLFLHCHIPAHDKVGMMGKLIVGNGSVLKSLPNLTLRKDPKSFNGIGIVISTSPRAGRLLVNHEEIKGFMSAMEMSYAVAPQSLLNGLNTGDKIRFTIDPAKSTVTSIDVIESVNAQ